VEARKHLDSKEVAELQKATENLTSVSNKMAEQMYKTAGNSAGGPSMNGAHAEAQGHSTSDNHAQKESKKDDVIDADYKEV